MTVTAGDVVVRTTELFFAVEQLVLATTALGLPALVAQLGVAGTAAELSRTLVGVLESIVPELEILVNLGRLGGLFGMIEPLVSGLRNLFSDAGASLASLGLGDALTITTSIARGFAYLEATAATGATLIIDPAQLDGLRSGLVGAIGAIGSLAGEFEAAAAAPA